MNAKQLKESIRIKDFLAYNGYKPIKDNGIDLLYLSPLRIEKTASFKVNDNLNFWFDFGLATGGNHHFKIFVFGQQVFTKFG